MPDPTGVGLGLRAKFLPKVARGDAAGAVRFFEVAPENFMRRGGPAPENLLRVVERFPIVTHGLMMSLGGVEPLEASYIRELRVFLDRVRTPWHSDHLCFCGFDGVTFHDLLPPPLTRATARRMSDRVIEAQDRLGRPMAVENISWYAQIGEPEMSETEFIADVLDRADCRLLLDVNNAFVNARNHGTDVHAWLREIPLDRVIQLHVAGHERWDDSLVVDTHGAAVVDPVLGLLEWVIERTGPLPVVLERDNNIPPLAELLDEVARLDAAYQRALGRWRERRPPAHHGS